MLSRISDTLAYCEEYGFTCSSQFQSIWDDLILAATAEGLRVSPTPWQREKRPNQTSA